MSKNMFFNRRFWQDQYTSDLDPVEKLLFVYLITNHYCGLTGIYELPVKYSSLETGLDAEMVKKILVRFHQDGKVFTEGSWVCVRNFPKYQKFSGIKLQKGIINELKTIPSHILLKFIDYGYPIDRLSILSSESDSESDSEKLEKIKKMIMSWDANKYSDDYMEEAMQTDPDYKPEKPKNKQGVSDDIQAVFDLFSNPAKVTWRLREIERVSAQALFDTYGLETLEKRIKRIEKEKKENEGDPYFPLVTTPSQLLDKMEAVERYLKI